MQCHSDALACADNTPKETKNQHFWFIVWVLCALGGTPLNAVNVVFGHA